MNEDSRPRPEDDPDNHDPHKVCLGYPLCPICG